MHFKIRAVNSMNIAGVMDKALVAIGVKDGLAVGQRINHITLERPDTVTTFDAAPLDIGWAASACVMGDTLYAVGLGQEQNELWKWNVNCDWTRLANLTAGRRSHCVAVVDLTLYTLGGYVDEDKETLNTVEAYDTKTDKWSVAGQLVHAVHGAACLAYRDSIYMFGGENIRTWAVPYVQEYNTAKNVCILLTNEMPKE